MAGDAVGFSQQPGRLFPPVTAKQACDSSWVSDNSVSDPTCLPGGPVDLEGQGLTLPQRGAQCRASLSPAAPPTPTCICASGLLSPPQNSPSSFPAAAQPPEPERFLALPSSRTAT